jgi:hypothetical protein
MAYTTSDRRTNRRYQLHLPIHYRVSERGSLPCTGSGTTCDMSTTGLSFRCRRTLPIGAHVELLIEWPSRYGDVYPIELQVTGFIVRNDRGRTGVRVTSRKFRVDANTAVAIGATA